MRSWQVAGAVSGALAVMLGAFGAHGLKEILGEDLSTWQTASHYHLVHSLVWVFAAYLGAKWPTRFFAFGVVIFSGSLYTLAAAKIRWMGAVAPVGGLSLIVGWALLALSLSKTVSQDADESPFRK